MLKNLKIRTKLFMMVALPVAGLLIFCLYDIKENYLRLQGLVQTEKLTGLAVQVGGLSHEIQKERGYSSGHLNAKGEKFREELIKQREKVDAEIKKVKGYLAQNEEALGAVKGSLGSAHASLDKLQGTRAGIDALRVTGPESYAFYTGLISSYMDVVAAVATTSGEHEVMRQATPTTVS